MIKLANAVVGIAMIIAATNGAVAGDDKVDHGKYLVTISGCGDCHTPGHFLGKPDMSKALSGSEVGFEIPQLGTFYGPNLTPDPETGLGNWSEDQIATAFTTGKTPDGRQLAPAMPWMNYANFKREDAQAIAAYLKSLPPIKNKVPGPFAPGEKPSSFVMRIVPPGG